jgi:tetratricopeptide (TPR) repeat protein
MSRAALLAALVVSAAGCRLPGKEAPEPVDPWAEERRLLEEGRLDDALARLEGRDEPEALYLQGRAWARKAETAPLPTPPPPPAPPVAPQFKPEELRALEALERAVALEPDHAGAHRAIADLLAPHVLERHQRQAAARRARGRRGAAEAAAAEPAEADAERVLRAYRQAADADTADREVVEATIGFAEGLGRLAQAEQAYQELLRRDRERPEPFVRYGDFLRGQKKDREAAIAQYAQALIWKPDEAAVKARIADIYLEMAEEHYGRNEWVSAEARLRDAQKYVTDVSSQEGVRLRELQGRLAQIRARPPGR